MGIICKSKKSDRQNQPKLLFFVTEDWYFTMHFLHFALAARENGWEITLVCNTGQKSNDALEIIKSAGIRIFPLKLSRTGATPFEDLKAFLQLFSFLKTWKPDLIHAIALKPILFSFIFSRLWHIPVINMMTGLGFVFTSDSIKARTIKPILSQVMRFALANPKSRLVVLNNEDALWAKTTFDLSSNKLAILPGIGIDTNKFKPCGRKNELLSIVFVGRMLKDKGLFELFEAAKILQSKGIKFKLRLAGAPDSANPEAVSEATISEWKSLDFCEFLGHISDVPEFLNNADLMVLPSYREGMPTCILEAASTGIPCVTTDVPGCREAVKNGVTGLIVPPKNSVALAEALMTMAQDKNLREKMGLNARELVMKKYSQQLVLDKILQIYENGKDI